MKKILLFSFFLTVAFSLTANDNPSQEDFANSYKYQIAKKVFDNLIDAKGDSRLQVPEFIWSTKKRYVAWMNGKEAEVGIEEAAYDICTSFGADSLNALASLLGHEITHYYEKHSWGNEFASAYANLQVSSTVKSASRSKDSKSVNETEADYLGGFLAYSAGYKTFGIMPEFLNEVYDTYALPAEIPGYPALEDRIKLAIESEMRLEELTSVYEAANYMIVLGEYEDVDNYYRYILKEYQSREIYNNAGVNMLASALAMIPDGEPEKKYVYPIQLDGDTRLDVKTRNSNQAFAAKDKVVEMLNKAVTYFEQAYSLDSRYATALVNLACAKDLLGAYDDAAYFAKKAVKVARENEDNKVQADAYIIRGISNIHEGETEDGRDYLERARNKAFASRELADLNLYIFENNERPAVEAPKQKLSLSKEMVDGFDLNAFMDSPDLETLLDISSNIQLGVQQLENSKLLLHLFNGGERFVLLQQTNANYSAATSLGLGVGATKEEIIAKYGQPSFTQQSKDGQYLVYKPKKVIFRIANDELKSWALYRQ